MVEHEVPNRRPEVEVNEVSSYHVKAAVRAFEKVLPSRDPENGERSHTLGEVLNRFIEKSIDNVQIHKGEDGAAFPYTTLNITEFVKDFYKQYAPNHELPPTQVQEPSSRKDYVVFGSFPSTQNGHPFTFVEVAMQQTLRHMGTMAKAIEAGKPLPDVRVTTLGGPFNNRWGEVTPEYVEKVKADPMGAIGHSYAEMLKKTLPTTPEEKAKTSVLFEGISMGGRLAIKTAEELTREGVLTRDQEKRHGPDALPFVQVLVDSTPGVNGAGGPNQVPLGFVAEVGIQTLKHPSMALVALRENKFLARVEKRLEARGIQTNTSKEQIKLKKEATKSVVKALGKPAQEPSLKVESRRGMLDPLLYSHSWRRAARREQKAGRVPVETKNGVREWAINATHLFPFYSRGEMRSWKNSVDVLRSVSKQAENVTGNSNDKKGWRRLQFWRKRGKE